MTSGHATHQSYALSRYRLEHRIASGSAGTVFAARDVRTERQVIVKFIDNADDSLGEWIKEARLALRLKHENIARCLDVGYDDNHGLWALVYERAMGGSLRKAMVAGYAFAREEIVELIRGLASALHCAHQRGVIHRDVKPENVLAGRELGKPPWLLTDFGAGRFLESGSSAASVVGSLAYMAPEVMSKSADALCDCFSLGMVGAELFMGRIPDRSSRSEFVLDHRHAGGIHGVLASMVEAFPERRPPTVGLVAELLSEGPAPNYAVLGRADGDSYVLNGDIVRQANRNAFEPPRTYRIPRAVRFLGFSPEGYPIIASHRRITVLRAGRSETVFASDHAHVPWAYDYARSALWVRRGEHIAFLMLDQEAVESHAELPEALRTPPVQGALEVGACAPDGAAVLSVVGSKMIVRAVVEANAIAHEVHALEQPVRAIAESGGRILAVCGDSRGAQLLDLSGPAPVALGWSNDPADAIRVDFDGETLWMTSGATTRTEQLFDAPMSSSARAV